MPFLQTPTCVLTDLTQYFYGQGPVCCWKLLPRQTIAICSDFYNTSVCMFQIPLAKRLEHEGLLSLSGILGIPSQAREPQACHETISQPHTVHAIHVFLHQECEYASDWCSVAKLESIFPWIACTSNERSLRCRVEICSLISFDPVPLSLYFTYEALIWVLMRMYVG